MENSIEKAVEIALKAHKGQVDKAGKPYILHPMTVAVNMKTTDGIIAALLHDVVEDSDITLEDLEKEFTSNIIEALKLLTHDEETEYFDYIKKIKSNTLAKSVKIQDLMHNSDVSRLENVTQKDIARVNKYKKALDFLTN